MGYFKSYGQFINEKETLGLNNPNTEVKQEEKSNKDFEYKGYQCKIPILDRYSTPNGEPAYGCAVYKDGEYKMGIRGPGSLQQQIDNAKIFIDGTIERNNK